MFNLNTLSRHASIAIITILTHELCVAKNYSFETRIILTTLVNLALNFVEHSEIIMDNLTSQETNNNHHYFMDNIKFTSVVLQERNNFDNGFPANHNNHPELKM